MTTHKTMSVAANLVIEAETDTARPCMTGYRVTAKTEHECQGQIEALMDDANIVSSEFTMPAQIHFTDDPCIGMWRSLGFTVERIV